MPSTDAKRRDRMRALVREELEQIEEQLGELEPQLEALRAERTQVLRMLRLVEPEAPEVQAKTPSTSTRSSRISQAKVAALSDWLHEHRAEFPDGFALPDLIGYDGSPVSTKSALTSAIPHLVEQGVVRVDRLRSVNPDGSPVHGRKPKVYKLVGP